MARSRSLPTALFRDPDFFDLTSDTQIILVGLVLGADDAGRGLAHAGLLARELNKEVALVEQAFADLGQAGMLVRYQAGQRTYYQLCHWAEWETLSKPTPSRYPAPPTEIGTQAPCAEETQGCPKIPRETQGNSGQPRISPPEEEGEEEKEVEEEKEHEGEGPPPNVVTFPTTRDDATVTSTLSAKQRAEMSRQVAAILHLPQDAALSRIVEDYCHDPTLSLLGEADAAREWIDDTRRNRHGQRMSPAFFRRWLKRERDDALKRRGERSTGTIGPGQGTHAPTRAGAAPPDKASDDPYAAFLARRVREVATASTPRRDAGGGNPS